MIIYCDTHVHCYQFDELATLLDQAWDNFNKVSANPKADRLVLFFTDGVTDKTWRKLTTREGEQVSPNIGEWHFSEVIDGLIQIDRPSDGALITLAPARQINSKERLEFLILGCADDIEDGIPAGKIIQDFSRDTVVICPWGVGKWLSSRGALLTELISDFGDSFFLGDNGGRPWFWSANSHFSLSQHSQISGSDPLPIAGELGRVGGFGIQMDSNSEFLDLDGLLSSLKNKDVKKTAYGKPMGLFAFIKKRVQMLVR